jgi:uncharacterized protein (DUF433 family)
MSRKPEPYSKELRARADRLAEFLVGRHPEIVRVPGVCGGRAVFAESRLPVGVVICLMWQGKGDKDLIVAFPRLNVELFVWLRSLIEHINACERNVADANSGPQLGPRADDLRRAVRILAADRAANRPPAFAPAVEYALAVLAAIGIVAQVEQLIDACDPVRPALIEEWFLVDVGESTHLVGRVTGHPTVPDGHRALSTWVIGTSKERGLVLTFSGQLYRLGRPWGAPRPADEQCDPYDTAEAESAPMPERLH